MPILSPIGRRHFSSRLLIAGIYTLLILGAITMLYPLGLMMAGSTKSLVDLREFVLIPRFLVSSDALYQKHMEALFNESIDSLNLTYDTDFPSFAHVEPPPADDPSFALVPHWKNFLAATPLPSHAIGIGHYWAPQTGAFPKQLREFRRGLQNQYTHNLDTLNHELNTDFEAWYTVFVQPPAYLFPHASTNTSPLATFLDTYKQTVPPLYTFVYTPNGYFKRLFLKSQYTRHINEYNRAHHTRHPAYTHIHLSRTFPHNAAPLEQDDWTLFIEQSLNPLWRQNPDVEITATILSTPDTWFQDYLAAHTDLANPHTLFPPQRAYHYQLFLDHIPELRKEFIIRNYITVLDYLFFHSRGILNTVIYCTLAVLLALLVNPLAAYALSRYKPPFTYQILLFLMITMAFPHMVTQIPVFLLLRQLGLLNTFAALLLPGMASGYSIFLLKGFFDSLPQDLYESAQLDGAGEWTLFWHITMRLSTPILSVIALQAFSVAYANFMYALLICQDSKMWTLMVWLYQLQQRTGPGVMYASLLLAAIPTLVVFIACQRVLLRGIVIPVEK